MSEREKADFRAQGALQNFILEMQGNLNRERRTPEYQAQFWASLRGEMRHMIRESD